MTNTKWRLKILGNFLLSIYKVIIALIFRGEITVNKHNLKRDPNKQKCIFVFLDGTENTEKSQTNVWRLLRIGVIFTQVSMGGKIDVMDFRVLLP